MHIATEKILKTTAAKITAALDFSSVDDIEAF